MPRAISWFIRVVLVQPNTLPVYSRFSVSLSYPLFFFPFFFCSLAAARRQEQHGQTGFLSLAVIHLSKCRSFPSTVLFYSKFLSLICHQNVVSHASNLVTHLAVLSLLNIDILFFSNVSKHCSSAWSGGHSCVSFQRNWDAVNRFLLFLLCFLKVVMVLWQFISVKQHFF